ncbi:MAG: hypothetical protein IPN94_22575 [Sphingobacteriales bacterium]|nr:hypothetical protein [Sphingobacteriales bacterium]
MVLSTKFTNEQQQQALSLVLQKIDFITTLMLVPLDTAFDKLIHESVPYLLNAKKLFDHLHNYIAKQAHKLSVTEKKLLFDTLRLVDGIAEGTLADLCLFANQAGEIAPLKNLLPSNLNTPTG